MRHTTQCLREWKAYANSRIVCREIYKGIILTPDHLGRHAGGSALFGMELNTSILKNTALVLVALMLLGFSFDSVGETCVLKLNVNCGFEVHKWSITLPLDVVCCLARCGSSAKSHL